MVFAGFGAQIGCADLEGSCAFTQSGIQVCAEFSGGRTDLTADSCASTFRGTYSDAQCATAGRVGGCRMVTGSVTATTWFYAGSVATIRAACPGGSTFVMP